MPRALVVRGLAVPPSITLARAAADPLLVDAFGPGDFAVWPDAAAMQADLQAGTVDLAIIPTNVAANLYQQGISLGLARVTVWGILHVMTRRGDMRGWEDLAGRTVAVPLRGNMPDTIFTTLLARVPSLAGRVTLRYMTTYVAAMEAMLAGESDAAVLPEPIASAAEARDARRALDLQAEWGRLVGGPPRYPQAGAVVSRARWTTEGAALIGGAIDRAVAWMGTQPDEAGALGASLLGLDAATVTRSLRLTHWESLRARAARGEIERFFTVLRDASPALLPDGLPGDGFYLD
jgi:NitT/TauT family transport system substrate-binding protein